MLSSDEIRRHLIFVIMYNPKLMFRAAAFCLFLLIFCLNIYQNLPVFKSHRALFCKDNTDYPYPDDSRMYPFVKESVRSKLHKLAEENTKANDPELVALTRKYLLEKKRPFLRKKSLRKYYLTPQIQAVDKILKKKQNGFFVECGAFDGEQASNTAWLEEQRGWTGVLVEMDPSYYMQIRGKNRNVTTANICLSPQPYATIIPFKESNRQLGRLNMENSEEKNQNEHNVFCVPFWTLMLALNRTTLDYFSLDVEGLELEVLKTIPFDKVSIYVLTVEYIHGEKDKLAQYMTGNGFQLHSTIDFVDHVYNVKAHDFVFVKNDRY